MSFIIDVFGANITIMFAICLWVFGAFFTMKNVFKKTYDSIKRVGMKDEYNGERIYDYEKYLLITTCLLFLPFIMAFVIVYLIIKLIIKSSIPLIKALDKIIPRVEIEKEKKND